MSAANPVAEAQDVAAQNSEMDLVTLIDNLRELLPDGMLRLAAAYSDPGAREPVMICCTIFVIQPSKVQHLGA